MPAGFDINTIIQSPWFLVGIVVVYAILPATSPIKVWINKLIGGIINPTPTPTPAPGPTPTPTPAPVVGLDWSAILQLLMSLLTKARATNNKELEDAVLKTASAIQDEQAKMAASPLYMSMHR